MLDQAGDGRDFESGPPTSSRPARRAAAKVKDYSKVTRPQEDRAEALELQTKLAQRKAPPPAAPSPQAPAAKRRKPNPSSPSSSSSSSSSSLLASTAPAKEGGTETREGEGASLADAPLPAPTPLRPRMEFRMEGTVSKRSATEASKRPRNFGPDDLFYDSFREAAVGHLGGLSGVGHLGGLSRRAAPAGPGAQGRTNDGNFRYSAIPPRRKAARGSRFLFQPVISNGASSSSSQRPAQTGTWTQKMTGAEKHARKQKEAQRWSTSPLVNAIRTNDLVLFERALAAGASVETTGLPHESWGTTPVPALMLAITLGRTHIAKLLLELGGDAYWQYPVDDSTAMHASAYYGNVEMARLLATRGAHIETPNKIGQTPAYLAAKRGNTEVVRVLAEFNANVETPAEIGATPVCIAAGNGRAETVRLLAELGASVTTPNKKLGATPVCYAAHWGQAKMVRVLAELGASVTTPNKKGNPPIYFAVKEGHTKVLRVLVEFGASMEASSATGRKLLYISVINNRIEATKALLLLGAPITIEDLKQTSDAKGDTRQLRVELQTWAADLLVQHRIFCNNFLFGCSAHPSMSTQQTTTVIPLDQPNNLSGTHTTESPATYFRDAATGTVFTTTSVTTITPTEVTTVTTHTRITNPHLPTIAGMPGVLERIAAFAGIVVGKELRRTRAVGPAIAAVNWAAHDERRRRN